MLKKKLQSLKEKFAKSFKQSLKEKLILAAEPKKETEELKPKRSEKGKQKQKSK